MLGIIVFLALFGLHMGQNYDGLVPVTLIADMGDFKIKKIEGGHTVEEFHHTAPTLMEAVSKLGDDLLPFITEPKSFQYPFLPTYIITRDASGKPMFKGEATGDIFLTDSSLKHKSRGVRRIFKETIIYSVPAPFTAGIKESLRIASKLFKDLTAKGLKFDAPNVHFLSYGDKRNELFVIKKD